MNSQLRRLPLLEQFLFPSRYGIGDPVTLSIGGKEVDAWIRTVTFTNGKVRYSVKANVTGDENDGLLTTLHNLDSVLLKDREGEPMEFTDLDNYS